MITDFMEDNGMFDVDLLIPTNEEMEKTIKHITETGEISFEDEFVLWRMHLIHKIVNSKGVKL